MEPGKYGHQDERLKKRELELYNDRKFIKQRPEMIRKIEETSKELVILAMEISRQKIASASGLILAPFDEVWEA